MNSISPTRREPSTRTFFARPMMFSTDPESCPNSAIGFALKLSSFQPLALITSPYRSTDSSENTNEAVRVSDVKVGSVTVLNRTFGVGRPFCAWARNWPISIMCCGISGLSPLREPHWAAPQIHPTSQPPADRHRPRRFRTRANPSKTCWRARADRRRSASDHARHRPAPRSA